MSRSIATSLSFWWRWRCLARFGEQFERSGLCGLGPGFMIIAFGEDAEVSASGGQHADMV